MPLYSPVMKRLAILLIPLMLATCGDKPKVPVVSREPVSVRGWILRSRAQSKRIPEISRLVTAFEQESQKRFLAKTHQALYNRSAL